MGYRTNGKWIITGPVDKVITALVTMRLEIPERKDAGFGSFESFKRDGVGYIRLEFEGWKWYASCDDIKWFESVWDWLDAHHEDFELSGKRVHVGEDNAVYEYAFGTRCIDLYVSTRLSDDEHDSGEPLVKEEICS